MKLRHLVPGLALLAASCACTEVRKPAGPDAASGPAPGEAMLDQRGKVNLLTRGGAEFQVSVEIASNDETRARGLMFRRSMPEDAGMLFVFAEERHQSFWMKNTYLPLDMLFVDAKGTIVGIVENAEPHTLTSRSVPGVSKFVLELNGGWCARHGVAAGDRMTVEGMYDLQ
jgi:uncharacterized membrane protein (UPF0127 family)